VKKSGTKTKSAPKKVVAANKKEAKVKKAAAKVTTVVKKLTFGEEAEEVIGAADGTPEQKVSGHLDESTPFSVGHQE
jgi:hypothetical protein